MTKNRSTLNYVGLILTLIGAIILTFIGIFLVFVVLINAFSDIDRYNYRFFPIYGFDNIAYGIIYSIIGLITIWACFYGKIHQNNKELFWGIIFIVFGLIGESVGGIIMIFGGIMLLIDFLF